MNWYYISFSPVIWKYSVIKKVFQSGFNITILILSCPWALLGSSFLKILLTCSTEKSTDVKTDSVWVVNLVGNWLLLTRGVHCPAKYELKSSHFALISDILCCFDILVVYKIFFYHSIMFLEENIIFKDWDFYQIIYGTYYRNISFSLIDFRVDWDLEYIERETENYDCFYDRICLCKFDFCSLSNFWFFYQTTEAPCHQRLSTYLE